MLMKNFQPKKFKQPYKVLRKGRGKTTDYQESRLWHQNTAPAIWKEYSKSGCKFVLVWADPATAKSHFSIAFGEAIPFNGTNAILVHTDNLVKQHSETVEYYADQGFVQKQWKVLTIHQVYSWVNKLNKGQDIDDEDKLFIHSLEYVVADECHKYGKGDDAKMFETVMNYLFAHGRLKLIMGTTATGKYIDKIWNWAGTFPNRAQFTFRPNLADLSAEGYVPAPVEYINVDTKTKVFDRQVTDSLGIRADDPTFDQYCNSFISTDPDDAINNLIAEEHKVKFRNDKDFRIESIAYQDNRVDVAIDHWIKKELGEVAIINVRGIINAKFYQQKYESRIKNLGHDIIYWNGDAKKGETAHPIYKNNEKKMLADLRNPAHPLKVVITNGMLKEGTNEEIKVVYQCAFTPGGVEGSIQVGNRGEYTVIMLDAMNVSKLPAIGWKPALQQTLIECGFDRTPDELIAAAQIHQQRLAMTNPAHKTPNFADTIAKDQWMNEQDDEETDDGTLYHTILSKDIWVKEVEYIGSHNTSGLALHNNHQTLFEALDILVEAENA
jgi:hypothetical protein